MYNINKLGYIQFTHVCIFLQNQFQSKYLTNFDSSLFNDRLHRCRMAGESGADSVEGWLRLDRIHSTRNNRTARTDRQPLEAGSPDCMVGRTDNWELGFSCRRILFLQSRCLGLFVQRLHVGWLISASEWVAPHRRGPWSCTLSRDRVLRWVEAPSPTELPRRLFETVAEPKVIVQIILTRSKTRH